MNRNRLVLAVVGCALTACTTLDLDNTRYQESRKLGVVFLERGQPVATKILGDVSVVPLTKPEFVILTPATEVPIRICASSSPVIFLQSQYSSPTCFGPDSELPGSKNDPLALSLGDKHTAFALSGTGNGKQYRAVYIDGIEAKNSPKDIYLTIYIDSNTNGKFERKEFEHFALALPREGKQPHRTENEIQPVFDIHQNKLDRLYKKALRNNPVLAGKMTLKFTILPSGQVANASVVSSTMKNRDFDRKVLDTVRDFQFGPKHGPAVIIRRSLEFPRATKS